MMMMVVITLIMVVMMGLQAPIVSSSLYKM